MDSRLRGKDENRRVPSSRPGPQSQKQVRIKKAAMLDGIVFPGSPESRCIRPDRNLKYSATQEQPDDRGSMLGLRHHKNTTHTLSHNHHAPPPCVMAFRTGKAEPYTRHSQAEQSLGARRRR